jgi:LmbE family N-acetylglucosaminyl deacetylase
MEPPVTADNSLSLFVSPHFDDAALSCGGTVALAARAGGARVVTVFAGEATSGLNEFAQFQHQRWGTGEDAVGERQREDLAAMRQLGAESSWLDFPDAIYRERLYVSDEDLFGPVKAEDMETAMAVVDEIVVMAGATQPARIYLPLAVGGHVDHRICRMAARGLLDAGHAVWLYEDFPYAATPGAVDQAVGSFDLPLTPSVVDVSEVLGIRLAAIEAYASQLPTIFRNYGPYYEVIWSYAQAVLAQPDRFGERFWQVRP